MNHTLPSRLDTLEEPQLAAGSQAYWAKSDPTACVIFVHGFSGHACLTWGDFGELAVEHDAFAESDIFFIGYESRSSRAGHSAAVIGQFLARIGEDPGGLQLESFGKRRENPFEYKSIVIIAHSLGAAIVRDAVMAAKREERDWTERVKLGLFAPAHLGADALELARTASGLVRWMGVVGVRIFAPVLDDLKQGSRYLTYLLESAKEIGVHPTTKARFVVHVANDLVVDTGVFFRDPQMIPYHRQTHSGCCKPIRISFLKPIDTVARVLKDD